LAEYLDIPVTQLEPNIFLTRYSEPTSIDELAESIRSLGQLEAIAVRQHPTKPGCYQIIYGHRRLAAIRKLGLKEIRAEVKFVSDSGMLQMAIVENLQRQDASDYEKGLLFRKLSEEFDLTYEEIGRLIGKSKQLVSNHIAMTKICTDDDVRTDAELLYSIHKLTEAHARVLARIEDSKERVELVKLCIKEHLCARELKALIGRPRESEDASDSVEWIAENIRHNSDNTTQMQSKHGRVCVIRTDSLNFLISKLKITPYEAGAEIGRGASKILLGRGIDPRLPRNWSKVLIEKSKYAGWGKMSTTTDSRLIVHEPSLNSDFLRGYLETVLGVKLRCTQNSMRMQEFRIVSLTERKLATARIS
jgi:ParB/RepB/Spo0J family partition protein